MEYSSVMSSVIYLFRDLGFVQPSDLNMQCVHHQPNSSHTVPYYTQCYYEAFVRVHIFDYLGLKHMQFLPPKETWANIAPTWNDSIYRHQVMQVGSTQMKCIKWWWWSDFFILCILCVLHMYVLWVLFYHSMSNLFVVFVMCLVEQVTLCVLGRCTAVRDTCATEWQMSGHEVLVPWKPVLKMHAQTVLYIPLLADKNVTSTHTDTTL